VVCGGGGGGGGVGRGVLGGGGWVGVVCVGGCCGVGGGGWGGVVVGWVGGAEGTPMKWRQSVIKKQLVRRARKSLSGPQMARGKPKQDQEDEEGGRKREGESNK